LRTRTTTAAIGLLTTGLLLTGCSGGGDGDATPTGDYGAPGPVACKAAIKDQYAPGTIQLTGAPTEPPACLGLTTDEVSQIATEVIDEQLGN